MSQARDVVKETGGWAYAAPDREPARLAAAK
jgi:hypothetical protein